MSEGVSDMPTACAGLIRFSVTKSVFRGLSIGVISRALFDFRTAEPFSKNFTMPSHPGGARRWAIQVLAMVRAQCPTQVGRDEPMRAFNTRAPAQPRPHRNELTHAEEGRL